jgi:hypothetical protein
MPTPSTIPLKATENFGLEIKGNRTGFDQTKLLTCKFY